MQRHECFELQKGFNPYGSGAFPFEILSYGPAYEEKRFRKQREAEFILACSKKNQVYNDNPSKRRHRFLQRVSIRGKV